MKSLPKISIVIPCYNEEKYISKTLDSIVTQNYRNLEVIVQDGGSKDKTVSILKRYGKKYPKIFKITSKRDRGQLDAINKGFRKAKGEVFCFINGDDVYSKGALSKVGNYFAKYPNTLWVAGQGNVIDSAGHEISEAVTTYKNTLLKIGSRKGLLMTNYLMQPAVFLSKKAYGQYGPFEGIGRIVMEYALWLKLSKAEMPKVINAKLASFRLTSENLSSTQTRKILDEDFLIAEKHTKNPVVLRLHKLHNSARIIVSEEIFSKR